MNLATDAWAPDTDADLLAAVLAACADPSTGWTIYRAGVSL
jgi:hypothetical protein